MADDREEAVKENLADPDTQDWQWIDITQKIETDKIMTNQIKMEKDLNILIIDDVPENIQLLAKILNEYGFDFSFATSGKEAFEVLAFNKPDLILLDINMPGTNGFEVCKKLKKNPDTKDIPVIFLTARTEEKDIIDGLEIGAVDYITKPFKNKELIARVKIHLELQAAKDTISLQNKKLNQKINELRIANAIKDRFFSIIAHDLKNPFHNILGFSELLIANIHNYEINKTEKFIKILNHTAKKGYELLENLLEWARSQTGNIDFKPTKFDLKDIVNENIELLSNNAENKNISLLPGILDSTYVFADKNMINTVIRNLLVNAIKFTPERGKVEIMAKPLEVGRSMSQPDTNQQPGFIEISVCDTGVGIKQEDIKKLFRIDVNHSTIGTGDEKGTGLGLILCKEFIEKNKGEIWVESQVGKGSIFKFTLLKE